MTNRETNLFTWEDWIFCTVRDTKFDSVSTLLDV